MSGPETIVIGNLGNRRIDYFREAVLRAGHRTPRTLSWLTVCKNLNNLTALLRGAQLIRIESPGEDPKVERRLLALGASQPNNFPAVDRQTAQAFPEEHGRILFLHQWYLGFAQVLRCIADSAPADAHFFNHPEAIIHMFDKFACQRILRDAGVVVPPLFGSLEGYAPLRRLMREHGRNRVFLKPASGSSASGVMALQTQGDKLSAYSSVVALREGGQIKLFNSLKLKNYRCESELAPIIDTLANERCLVEAWIPKARFRGKAFDVRVLVIAGRACHRVVRLSRTPMTNLHLGNRRGDWEAVSRQMGTAPFRALLQAAERAARAFPKSVSVGVDVMLRARDHLPFVLEVNAFGDLLPGLNYQGDDPYAAAYEAMCRGGEKATTQQ